MMMTKLALIVVFVAGLIGCASHASIDEGQDDPYTVVCSYLDIDFFDADGNSTGTTPHVRLLVAEALENTGIHDTRIEASAVAHVMVRSSQYEHALSALAAAESLHGRDVQVYVNFISRPEELDLQGEQIVVRPVDHSKKPFGYRWVQDQEVP